MERSVSFAALWTGLCLLLSGMDLSLAAQGYQATVVCGDRYMDLRVSAVQSARLSVRFQVPDQTNQMVDVSVLYSCGYSAFSDLDGSAVLRVMRTACYIQVVGGYHVQNVDVTGVTVQGSVIKDRIIMRCMAPGSNPRDCQVAENEKLSCGDGFVNETACTETGCCFDRNAPVACYYSNSVTVQCTRDGQVVVVVSRNATRPQLSLGSVSMLGGRNPPCNPVRTSSAFTMFKFPVSACGTTMKRRGSDVVYENIMSAFIDVRTGPGGSITRDSTYKLLLQCQYAGNKSVPLQAVVYTIAPPPPVVAQGPLRVELRIAREQSYGSYYTSLDYPVTYVLREPVYVEVRILERTDTNIVLTLDDCWATSTPSPLGKPQWNLLVDGCPYRDDNYLTSLVPVDAATSRLPNPTHYKRFVLKMFTFVDPVSRRALKEMVYIHCSAAVCYPSLGSCDATCTKPRNVRDAPLQTVRKEAAPSKQTAVASSGAVILTAPDARALESWDFESEVPQSLGYGLMGVAASVVLVVFVLVPVAVWRLKPRVEETKL
ncbi:zona pellucida sperm-binding protein 4-like [Acipenser ruthenus]|uniref:zona pellucida sperm-binding protein 4-like n=1 Tax=Acipenser ruthenus TaxID=7906 RepID=UPI002740ACB2|nr:zona pellucida sperm-binding protein 4-like [Acipenser ruthenus]